LTERGFWHAIRTRLPRWAYWAIGAAIAVVGAFTAQVVADRFPVAQRLPFWIAGTAIIFAGLWVLSMGTKSRLDKIEQQDHDVD
jgi:sulfite exporter TauE/SafE